MIFWKFPSISHFPTRSQITAFGVMLRPFVLEICLLPNLQGEKSYQGLPHHLPGSSTRTSPRGSALVPTISHTLGLDKELSVTEQSLVPLYLEQKNVPELHHSLVYCIFSFYLSHFLSIVSHFLIFSDNYSSISSTLSH